MKRIALACALLAGCTPTEPAAPPAVAKAWVPGVGDRVIVGRLGGEEVPVSEDRESDWAAVSEAAKSGAEKLKNLEASGIGLMLPPGNRGTAIKAGEGYTLVRFDLGPDLRVPISAISPDDSESPSGRLSPRCCYCGDRPIVVPMGGVLSFKKHSFRGDKEVSCPGSDDPITESSQPDAP
jgi:hypothetical protein